MESKNGLNWLYRPESGFFFFLECGFIYIYKQHSAESLTFSYYRSVSLSLVVSRVVILERSGAHAAPWPHADRSGT